MRFFNRMADKLRARRARTATAQPVTSPSLGSNTDLGINPIFFMAPPPDSMDHPTDNPATADVGPKAETEPASAGDLGAPELASAGDYGASEPSSGGDYGGGSESSSGGDVGGGGGE